MNRRPRRNDEEKGGDEIAVTMTWRRPARPAREVVVLALWITAELLRGLLDQASPIPSLTARDSMLC
jgi:hypothetical protein